MSEKTKIFSLVILGLLFLPVLMSPARGGQVLGTNESAGEVSQVGLLGANNNFGGTREEPGVVARENQVGSIASGVHSSRSEDDSIDNQVFSGKAIVNANASVSVSSDKFPVGSSVEVKVGEDVYNLVVQGRSVLSADTILVFDQETYNNLGGSVDQTELQVSVRQN